MELVKLLPVHRYNVDIFSYSGPSEILGTDGDRMPLRFSLSLEDPFFQIIYRSQTAVVVSVRNW